MTTEFSQTGHRYQLILRGECGPLEGRAVRRCRDRIRPRQHEPDLLSPGRQRILRPARPDPGPGTPPDQPLRDRRYRSRSPSPGPDESCPSGTPPLYRRGTPYPPQWGPAVLPPRRPGPRARNAKASRRIAQPPSGRASLPRAASGARVALTNADVLITPADLRPEISVVLIGSGLITDQVPPTLETVKHHLKPNRQRSVGPRQTVNDQLDLGKPSRHWT